MTAPLTRDQQIELMDTVQERNEAKVREWMADATVRAVFCKPAPGQTAFRHREMKVSVG